MILSKEIHNKIYLIGLFLLAASMPLSVFMMSVSQIILLLNWILELNFKEKFKILFSRKSLLIFSSIFIVHIVWLINTTDFHYAYNDLRVKVPILVLPIIIGTSNSLNYKQIKNIFLAFSAAILLGTLISLYKYMGFGDSAISDVRQMSSFISHIRFSLMINLAIFALLYYSFKEDKLIFQIILILVSIWFLAFLFILQSFTGLIIFLVIGFIYAIYTFLKSKNVVLKVSFITALLLIVIYSAYYVMSIVSDFYDVEELKFSQLDIKTPNGNYYNHDTLNLSIENGNYIYVYVCHKELEDEWAKRINVGIDRLDAKGQIIRYTLIRYLSSLGLRKDAEGVRQLKNIDINAVLNGVTNFKYPKVSIEKKIYEFVWEFDNILKDQNPNGKSTAQRIEYIKAGYDLVKRNLYFGVGTGDVQAEFNSYYEMSNSKLNQDKWLRAHNQLLTFIITFGIIGFLIIFFGFIYPIINEKSYKILLFNIFLIISLLSFLNEDTLETQAGITFFVFFYTIFVFGFQNRKQLDSI